jgi:replicative DNA helicase
MRSRPNAKPTARPRLLTERQVVDLEAQVTRATEHEATLLASALNNPIVAGQAASNLTPEDFADSTTRAIFEAVQALVERHVRPTVLSVVDYLRQHGGDEFIGATRELADGIPLHSAAKYAVEKIQDASKRRAILRACREAASRALDLDCADPLSEAYGALLAVRDPETDNRIRHIADVYNDQVRLIQEAAEATAAGRSPVPLTGFQDLDSAIVLGPGKLVVLAARPGMGKSALMSNIAMHVAKERLVVIVTLEMTGEEIAGRHIAANLKLSARDQAAGRVPEGLWETLWGLSHSVRELKLYVADPSSVTMAGIEAAVRQVAMRAGLPVGMVLIDYIGLIDEEGENETAKVGAISRKAKKLAMALRCPVWMLSQLNRGVEQRQDKRPLLSDLRSSGSVEQDADIVIFIYRDDYYYGEKSKTPGVADLLIPKNRGGAAGVTVNLLWRPNETRFYSLATGPSPFAWS